MAAPYPTKYNCKSPGRSPGVKLCHLILCVLIGVGAGACSLTRMGKQTAMLENLATLQGTVKIDSDRSGPVLVLLFRHTAMGLEVVNRQALYSDSSYLFYLEAGVYSVGAFIDVNGDGAYIGDEPATYPGEEVGEPTLFDVGTGQSLAVQELVIARVLNRQPETPVIARSSISQENIGRIVSLSDDRFSPANSKMGLWRPVDFLETIGAGLFLLQEFDEHKTPVVFVHGINGSPANFDEVVPGLDRDKFQPWVLHYPSGLSLDMTSDYLLRALDQLQADYQFPEVYIVAHSMGGLMIRSFVLRHQKIGSAFDLGLVVTINSPLYGMQSAAIGVKNSPAVLPAWRDLAPESAYIQRVHGEPWPSHVPYHLVFSYQEGEDGDGVVPLRSQLSRSLQQEALDIHGFDAQHSSILGDAEFILKLNRILLQPRS